MPHADFIHLRVHSAYSLSEGAIKVPDLVSRCAGAQMPAVAITDRGNLFGALEFSQAALKEGVQPIIGMEIAVTSGRQDDQTGTRAAGRSVDPDWVVLLVQNETGWQNLMALSSKAFLETDAGEAPQITFEDMAAHADGLIALTGGPDGPVGRLLLDGQDDAARALTEQLASVFPGRLYMEIMRHGEEREAKTEARFIDLAYALDIPLIATNDVYFGPPEMYEAHDALMCIAQGAHIDQPDRRRVSPQHYFRSAEDMAALFADLPEAIDNTLVVARRCAFAAPARDPILPAFEVGEGRTEEDELRHQARQGLQARLEDQVFEPGQSEDEKETLAKPYRERLEIELDIIIEMKFPGYFLIVADFIRWSKEQEIPVGPGRGSGAGSAVAWALTITDLDPLRFGLLFERFLNPERVSMPDFDIDFCRHRRDEVIDYVCQRYGRDRVAQIITFGKLEAKAVIRDVGRVLGMPYGQVDRISKLIPFNPANPVRLSEAIDGEPQLQAMRDEDEDVRRLLGIALQLEGLFRHASTHAAGVVIGDRPLSELVPLYRDPRSTMPVTQFSMKYAEAAGLVKFDFLGLKTLTVLDQACRHIRAGGTEIDLTHIPLDDKKSFELMASGHTSGVFQLESSGMRDVLRGLKPDTFEDIIALVALYRPGPMENIPTYVACKHGEQEPDHLHEKLLGTLKETFGVIIYQEQVMEIARVLAGYSLGSADLLRRAMGKKIQSEMDAQREIFVSGAVKNDVDKTQASGIFDLVAKFAGYGFNKSHAAAYALVAYQTAYLKANFPVEFMAATMTLELNNTDKLGAFRQEVERLGVDMLAPDVNRSETLFAVEKGPDGKLAVRYALAAIKNVGEQAMETVVAERKEHGIFEDVFDFAGRLDAHALNKRQLENLAKAGAFDGMCENRRQVFNSTDLLMRHAEASRRDVNQGSLFDGAGEGAMPKPQLQDVPDWPPGEKLKFEQEAIGFYLSAHPLDSYLDALAKMHVTPFTGIGEQALKGKKMRLAGVVLSVQERVSGDRRFAFVTFSDPSGGYEVGFFRDAYTNCREILVPGSSLLVNVEVRPDGGLTADGAQPLEAVISQLTSGFTIHLAEPCATGPLQEVLQRSGAGRGRVAIIVDMPGNAVEIDLPGGFALSPQVLAEISTLQGIAGVQEQ